MYDAGPVPAINPMKHSVNTPTQNMPVRYGGIEAGGTKFVCAIGDASLSLLERIEFPTTTPDETLGRAIDFFRSRAGNGTLTALGIGSFGPVDPRPDSPTWGYITSTPKKGWRHTDFAGNIGRALGVPVGFDTDTNAAALGEGALGAAKDLHTFVYLTIGTGVGGGALVGGVRIHGLLHPEMGHMRLPRAEGDNFEGVCPFHGDCLEGMVSGLALHARAGGPPDHLPANHAIWTNMVHYLSAALVNVTCVLSPQRIILGGGVMHQRHLFPRIRRRVQNLLADYLQSPEIVSHPETFIVPPGLGDDAGVVGALALARHAAGGDIDQV